jgi:F-type H+-transporting ATPase subunit delta
VEEKSQYIAKLTGLNNEKFLNFVKILIINKRVDLLKPIYKAFNKLVSEATNTYEGVVEAYISETGIQLLEKELGKRFNANIKLKLRQKPVGGIKLFIDVLNVEVALIEDRLKEDLIQSILKAI